VAAPPSPAQIASALETRVVGQKEAVREISVALSKKLAGLRVGNVLLIGSSGSGKTTLMRAVEDLLAANPALARSIRNRFPYLDPLNHLQLELLKRHRAGDGDERVKRGIHLSINGLAAGLRNSG